MVSENLWTLPGNHYENEVMLNPWTEGSYVSLKWGSMVKHLSNACVYQRKTLQSRHTVA